MKSCADILHIETFIEQSLETARSNIIEEFGNIKGIKAEPKLLGRYRKEQIARLAKYNHM